MAQIARKIVISFAGMLVFALIGSYASAATIVGSKHDFSASNTTGSTPFAGIFYVDDPTTGFPLYIDEVCVFCHTPHGASQDSDGYGGTQSYLWNRVSSPPTGYSYKMYTSLTVSTGLVTGPTGVSMMCMSCHDGVTSLAVNTLKMNPGAAPAVKIDTGTGLTTGAISDVYAGAPPLYWGANIGNATSSTTDIVMTNDHPISFAYNYSKTDLKAAPSDPSLRLFGPGNDMLECATCHRVHDPTIPPFLAMSNAQSAMCLSCHIK